MPLMLLVTTPEWDLLPLLLSMNTLLMAHLSWVIPHHLMLMLELQLSQLPTMLQLQFIMLLLLPLLLIRSEDADKTPSIMFLSPQL